MKLKNRIVPILCTAIMAVSFMHPFFGKIVHAENEALLLLEETETKLGETELKKTKTEPEKSGTENDHLTTEEKEEVEKISGEEENGGDKLETEEDEKTEGKESEDAEGEKDAGAGKLEESESVKEDAEELEESESVKEDAEGLEESEPVEEDNGELEESEPVEEDNGELEESEPVEEDINEPEKIETQEWEVRHPVVRAGMMKSRRALPETMQEGEMSTFYGTGSVQIVEIPVPGIYRIEAAGNAASVGGSCTKGSIALKKGQKLYLYVANGQYNGTTSSGGNGGTTTGDDRNRHTMAAGGAATDIRLGGTQSSHRIMVAGGGGGSGYSNCAGAQALNTEAGNGNASGAGSGSTSASTDKRRSLSGGGGGGYYGGKITTDNSEVYYPKANAHIGTSYISPSFTNTSHNVAANGGSGYCKIKLERISLSLEVSAPSGWTNEDITITAKVKEEGEGLPDRYLSWEQDEEGNDIWTNETTYTVSENGTYTCKIRDVKGTQTQWPIEISQIDKQKPIAEFTTDIAEWTTSDITLQVEGDDMPATDKYGKSGLQSKAYLWGQMDRSGKINWEIADNSNTEGTDAENADTTDDLKEAWTDRTSYRITENGTYVCKIRDKAGNMAEFRTEIKNIDRTPPQVTYSKPGNWYAGSTKIILEAKDLQPDGSEGCGLAKEPYSKDGITFDSSPEFLVNGEGIYSIWVKDALGNIKETKLHLSYDRKEDKKEDDESEGKKDSGGGGEKEVDNIAIEPLPETELEKPEETSSGEDIGMTQYSENTADTDRTVIRKTTEIPPMSPLLETPAKAEKKIKKLPALEEKKEEEISSALQEQEKPEKKKINWKKTVLYSVWMAVVLCGVLWLLFCLIFEHVTVYRKDDTGKYQKIGRCAIIRKKDFKQVNLIHLMKKEEERDYKVRFAGIFVLLNKKEKVLLRTYQGVELRNVAKEIEILSCNC